MKVTAEKFFLVGMIIIAMLTLALAYRALYTPRTESVQVQDYAFNAENRTLQYGNTTVHYVLNLTYENGTLTYTYEVHSPMERLMAITPIAAGLFSCVYILVKDEEVGK